MSKIGPHKPELDELTPAQIRVVCEQLLYTMDSTQRFKFATELPGLYKKLYGSIPSTMVQQTANQIAHSYNQEEKEPTCKVSDERLFQAMQRVGL